MMCVQESNPFFLNISKKALDSPPRGGGFLQRSGNGETKTVENFELLSGELI